MDAGDSRHGAACGTGPDGELRLPWTVRGRLELQTKPATAISTALTHFTHLYRL